MGRCRSHGAVETCAASACSGGTRRATLCLCTVPGSTTEIRRPVDTGCHAADLRRGPRVPLPPDHDDQVRARHDARAAQRAGQPARGDAVGPRRRDEREGQRRRRWWPRRCARRDGGWASTPRRTWSRSASASGWTASRSPRARWRCGPSGSGRSSSSGRPPSSRPRTAIAFADFAARGAEIAVVEVGLGGRLDSTNVVRPLVSAVTKIERDHMKYLGDTLGADRLREGGDRQARGAVRDRRARPGAGARCCGARRGSAVGPRAAPDGRADVRVLPPDVRVAGPARPGGPAPAAERGAWRTAS